MSLVPTMAAGRLAQVPFSHGHACSGSQDEFLQNVPASTRERSIPEWEFDEDAAVRAAVQASKEAEQPQHRFDPRFSMLPIPGITSGMLPSGMNYDKIPRGTPIVGGGPPPSPLQQWIPTTSSEQCGPVGFQVGQPVRICHLLNPQYARYNGLVGDIIFVHEIQREDGTLDMLFDVRCPVEGTNLRMENVIPDQTYAAVQSSEVAKQAATANRAQIAPLYGMMSNVEAQDESCLPPFVLLSRLPSEKLEALSQLSGQSGGANRLDWLPPQVRPPIWGPPMPPVTVGQRSHAPTPYGSQSQIPASFGYAPRPPMSGQRLV